MRSYLQFKKDARQLRCEGKTYAEIREILAVPIPKSTLSNWCKDIQLSAEHQERIGLINRNNFEKIQHLAWASTQAKRQRLLDHLEEINSHLTARVVEKDIQKITLAMLHLGEGSKWHSHSGLMLGSSDPLIIQFYIRLLQKCYGINVEQLKCRISYRADQNIKTLEKYWSDITGISLKNFYRTKPDPRTVGKPTKRNDYKGVCVVHGGNTRIQHELEIIPKILFRGL